MKLWLLVLLGACQASNSGDYPPAPGGGGGVGVVGGGGGGLGGSDAGTDAIDADGDAGIVITGRVCVLKDVRQLTVCDDTVNASGLTVTLGDRTTTTTLTSGAFSISAPQGSGFTWHVTGKNFTTSAMPFGTDNTIPVIKDTQYLDLLGSNGVVLVDQQGSVFVRVVSGVAPVADVTATSNPPANNLAFYDSNSATVWGPDHTAAFGVVWFPAIPLIPSPATITLTPQGGTAVPASATIENQVITFITKDLL